MNILPIVHRELRMASRKRGTFISRAVVAGVVILLWLVLAAANARHASAAELARSLFWTYGILAMVYAFLSGVFFTADSLSAERREGTLGLLFLTDLKGFDVVLGKLAATSWHGVYSLLVILPVLALPLLMGGVSFAEMARLVMLLLPTLFYSLALGLLISTLIRRLTTAIALTFVVLLLQSTIPWALALVLDAALRWGPERNPMVWLCPFTSLVMLPDLNFRSGRASGGMFRTLGLYWPPILIMWTAGLAYLGLACGLLPRIWRREHQPARRRSRSGGHARTAPTAAGSDRHWHRALLERSPYGWLAARDMQHGWLTTLLMVLSGVWFLFLALSTNDRLADEALVVALIGAFVLHLLVKGWMALESSRRFCEHRQTGALELLLVTPVRDRDILRAEAGAIKRTFAFPLGWISGLSAVLLLVVVFLDTVGMGRQRWMFGEMILWGGLILWFDARALSHVGMLAGLRASRHHRAVLGTVARVLLPPWIGVFLFFVVVIPAGISEDGFFMCMRIWFVLCALWDFVLIRLARDLLEGRLRGLAAGEEPRRAPDAELPRPALPSPAP